MGVKVIFILDHLKVLLLDLFLFEPSKWLYLFPWKGWRICNIPR